MDEQDRGLLDSNNYLNKNLDKFFKVFCEYYGESHVDRIKEKFENALFIGYQTVEDTENIVLQMSKNYLESYITEELEKNNVLEYKKLLFLENNRYLGFLPIDKFKKFYETYSQGFGKRKEIFCQEGYSFFCRSVKDISYEEYLRYVNGEKIPDEYLNGKTLFVLDHLRFYLNKVNIDKKMNNDLNMFFNDISLPMDERRDFLNSDKFKIFEKCLNSYNNVLKRYEELNMEFNSYKKYFSKVRKYKEVLEKKYYKEYVNNNRFLFNEIQLKQIDDFFSGNTYNMPECLKLLLNSLKYESVLNCFSKASDEILMNKNSSNFSKKNIIDDRIKYFKFMGIDLGDDYESYLNNEEVKKIWPSYDIVNSVEKSRLDVCNRFNIEYVTTSEGYNEYKKLVDEKKFLNQDCGYDESLFINRATFVHPNLILSGNSDKLYPLVLVNINNQFEYNDHKIVHELNHLFELEISKIVGNQVEYLCGWDYVYTEYNGAKKENIDTVTIDKSVRQYELLNEIINEKISQEISKLMVDNDIYVFSKKGNSSYVGFTEYEKNDFLVDEFFKLFHDVILESRINNNIEILFDTVGKENFDELNELFKVFNANFRNKYEYATAIRNIRDGNETEKSKLLKDIIEKKDIILNNMKNYSSAKSR